MKFLWRLLRRNRLKVMTKADWIPELGPRVVTWWGRDWARFYSYVVLPVGAKPSC